MCVYIYIYIYMCVCVCTLIFDICFSVSDLLHSVWQSLGPSMSLQIVLIGEGKKEQKLYEKILKKYTKCSLLPLKMKEF